MVDPITGAGNPANVGQVNRSQNNRNENNTTSVDAPADVQAGDQIDLSPEALEAQANDQAREVRTILEQNQNEVLSGDAERVNALL